MPAISNTFNLDWFGDKPVPVRLTPDITQRQLEEFPAFKTWKTALQENLQSQTEDETHPFYDDPYKLRSITVQSVDWFGSNVGFVKLDALITADKLDDKGKIKRLPGIAFLRGGSVAVLMILRPKDSLDERHVVMTEQPRIPAGSMRFMEIPAGMLDKEGDFAGKAAAELEEETGFKVPRSELINMTELALRSSKIPTNMKDAMYPSPGGCDEFISLYLWEKELDRQEIEDLKGAMTGERRMGEMITLRVCEYEDLWREGARDAKTLAAWALYEGLNRSGILQKELRERKRARTRLLAGAEEGLNGKGAR
ncbi:hypothetical protein BX600DRAFT_380917 [Xylariales sp. PMI_506]|nr:hypothetical protein BX600DRAFT_380917 [Xylariales sp. PMI_506]